MITWNCKVKFIEKYDFNLWIDLSNVDGFANTKKIYELINRKLKFQTIQPAGILWNVYSYIIKLKNNADNRYRINDRADRIRI